MADEVQCARAVPDSLGHKASLPLAIRAFAASEENLGVEGTYRHRAIWKFGIAALFAILICSPIKGQTLAMHRIPASLAMEAANEVVSSCAALGYAESAIVIDPDGVTLAAASFKGDTSTLSQNTATTSLAELAHPVLFGRAVAVWIGNKFVGVIGAAGAPGENLDDGCAHAGLKRIQGRLH